MPLGLFSPAIHGGVRGKEIPFRRLVYGPFPKANAFT